MTSATNQKKRDDINRMADRLKKDEFILEQWTSVDGKTLVLDKFFNQKLDLYRDYDNDPFEPMYVRTGVDKDATVRFTDQVIYGWKQAVQAVNNRDPKDVELESVVHKHIVTPETESVIATALMRSDSQFNKAGEDIFAFERGEEEFDALMGTVHAKRTAEMLTEYVLIFLTTYLAVLQTRANCVFAVTMMF